MSTPNSMMGPAGSLPPPAGASAAAQTGGVPAGGVQVGGAAAGRRRARLVLTRVDPISVAKVALVLAVGLAIALIVAVTLLWVLFKAAGVFDTVSRTINDVAGSQVDAEALVGFGRIIGVTLLLSVVQVVLTTAFATLVAMLYNLAAYFVGGVSVTLTEDA